MLSVSLNAISRLSKTTLPNKSVSIWLHPTRPWGLNSSILRVVYKEANYETLSRLFYGRRQIKWLSFGNFDFWQIIFHVKKILYECLNKKFLCFESSLISRVYFQYMRRKGKKKINGIGLTTPPPQPPAYRPLFFYLTSFLTAWNKELS